MNTIIITGNLVREPDYREFPNGGGVCSLRIADSRKYTGKDGQQHEETLFIDVRAFQRLAKTCRQFLSKGSKIAVTGQLKSDEYTAKDGQKRMVLYIAAGQIDFLSAPPEQRAPRYRSEPDEGPSSPSPVDPRYAPQLDADFPDTPF